VLPSTALNVAIRTVRTAKKRNGIRTIQTAKSVWPHPIRTMRTDKRGNGIENSGVSVLVTTSGCTPRHSFPCLPRACWQAVSTARPVISAALQACSSRYRSSCSAGTRGGLASPSQLQAVAACSGLGSAATGRMVRSDSGRQSACGIPRRSDLIRLADRAMLQ
jgi:hypothetical protein